MNTRIFKCGNLKQGIIPLYLYLLCLLILSISFPQIAQSENKVFIKEYTYQAGELDSKVTSRINALEQVKRILLEQIGVLIIGESEVTNYNLTKEQITTITAGILNIDILDEKWDGLRYWIRAKIEVNPDTVKKTIEIIGQDKDKSIKLESARKRIEQLTDELDKIKSGLGGTTQERQQKYNQIVDRMRAYDWFVKGVTTYDFKKTFSQNEEAIQALNKAIELDSEFSDAYLFRGLLFYAYAKDYPKALSDINKSLDLFKENKDSKSPITNKASHYESRALIYYEMKKYKEVLQDLMTALEIEPDTLLMPKGQWEETVFDNLVKKYPNDYRAYILRGRYNSHFISPLNSGTRNDKVYDYAIRDLKKAISLNGKEPLAYLILTYPYHYKAFQYDVAHVDKIDATTHNIIVGLTTKGLQLKPNKNLRMRFFEIRAEEYQILKEYDDAIMDYDNILELDAELGGKYYDRALAYKAQKKYRMAISDFEHSLTAKKEPTTRPFQIYETMADTYVEMSDKQKALEYYNKSIEWRLNEKKKLKEQGVDEEFLNMKSGVFAEIYEKRANLYAQLGNYDKAIEDYTESLKWLPRVVTALEGRADAYENIRQDEKAISDIKAAIEAYKEYNMDASEAHWRLYSIYKSQMDYKNAIEQLDSILSFGADYVAYAERGTAYLKLGNNEQSFSDFTNALKLKSNDWRVYESRAIALMRMDKFEQAFADLNKTITLNPKEGDAYYIRAVICELKRNNLKAINDYKTSARLGNKDAQSNLLERGDDW